MAKAKPLNLVIYKITNVKNGKIYVGQDSRWPMRMYGHLCKLRKNKHHSPKLQRAYNKYGEECFVFEPIETLVEFSAMQEREQFWMDHYNSLKRGYNCVTANGSPLGIKRKPLTEQQRKNLSEACKGRKVSLETRMKLSVALKGRVLSEEWRRNNSLAQKGRVKTKEHMDKINAKIKGLKKSPEHLAKTVAALRRYERRRKIMKFMVYASVMMMLAGCAPTFDTCAAWKPIYPHRADIVTRGTKEQIIINNETWERVCDR